MVMRVEITLVFGDLYLPVPNTVPCVVRIYPPSHPKAKTVLTMAAVLFTGHAIDLFYVTTRSFIYRLLYRAIKTR
jgi:hypothetical protein